MERKAFIFIGRSGSGKGTQAKLLMDHMRKTHSLESVFYNETGSAFREFISKRNYSSGLAKDIMVTGARQPDFLAVWIWANSFINNISGSEHVVIDGTPRSIHEATILDTALSFYGFKTISVMHINISRKEAKKRLCARGRNDDNEKEIEKRLDWFDKDVVPAIEYYRKHPTCDFYEIEGEKTVSEIHRALIDSLFP